MLTAITAALTMFGPALLTIAEKAFAGKLKSGPDKMSWVKSAALWLIQGLAGAKLPDGSVMPPDAKIGDDALAGILETILAQAKASGGLTAPTEGEWLLVKAVSWKQLDLK